ncbi:MAG: glycoside hydrolase family 88 protein [Bacteroidaceae bacterium]|nr:glycoside hydrolase family 88 protein [Bacteroidaceae bacterium]
MKKIIISVSVVSLIISSACGIVNKKEELNAVQWLDYCNQHVKSTLDELGRDSTIDYSMMPRNIMDRDSSWHCRKASIDEWCCGFWPGILWYDYEATNDNKIRVEAEKFTDQLEFIAHSPAYDHDSGFMIFCSYGNAYRLTHNDHYKEVILAAADSLATLYNPNVGTILSWPRNVDMFGGHNTIMDNMVNLEMLFWASKNGGSHRLYDIAVNHARTTMEHHFRPDYSCYHVAVYDADNGDFIKGVTHQGYSDDSMWARGQAWAIYGYTMVYRETRMPEFLDFAQKVTDVYLSRLPHDGIPFWDFDDPSIPNAPRDASAACVVASALIELSGYVNREDRERYIEAAENMLVNLSSNKYLCNESKNAFLRHSVGHKPAGSEIDASIIYADYYYIEALIRYNKVLNNNLIANVF